LHDDETLPAESLGSAETRAATTTSSGPAVGDVLLGRYRLESELGRGGFAQVFEAVDEELERRVAIKALLPGVGDNDTEGWQRLLDEARLQADVESPGVARLLDAVRDGDRRYLVMDMVRGPELSQVIARLRERSPDGGPRPSDGSWLARAAGLTEDAPGWSALAGPSWDRTVAGFGARLADAVAGLHARGLVHRDLKPGNVKLDEQGEPMVLDFGLAGRLGDDSDEPTRGTPRYMAPEQLDDRRHRRDPRTDVHQVGLILFELLTLRPAHGATTHEALLAHVRAGRLPRVHDTDGAAERGLAAVIDRAKAPEPDQRYGDLLSLADDLRRVARGAAPRQAVTPLSYRVVRGAAVTARHPVFVATASALLLAAVAWLARSAMEPDLTSLEGWRFHPGAERLEVVATGSEVAADDDLGVRVSSNERTWIYAVSVYGGDDPAAQRVSPLYPMLLEDGRPVSREDASWGLQVEPGAREVLCARLADPAPWEGLLVFAAREPVKLLERWLVELDARAAESGQGVPHAAAFAALDTLREPEVTRGQRVSPDDAGGAEERYASLDGSSASGESDWDLGADLVRYQLMCRVPTP
jgi:hypothetical protein